MLNAFIRRSKSQSITIPKGMQQRNMRAIYFEKCYLSLVINYNGYPLILNVSILMCKLAIVSCNCISTVFSRSLAICAKYLRFKVFWTCINTLVRVFTYFLRHNTLYVCQKHYFFFKYYVINASYQFPMASITISTI